jgi:hypothetical protein
MAASANIGRRAQKASSLRQSTRSLILAAATPLLFGCATNGVQRQLFDQVALAAKAARDTTHRATSLEELEEVLGRFARALSSFAEANAKVADRPISDSSRRLIVMYGAAFTAYRDSVTIWRQTLPAEQSPSPEEIGRVRSDYFLDSTAGPGAYDPDSRRFGIGDLRQSIETIWKIANRRVLSADAVYRGKETIAAAADEVFSDYPDMRPDLDFANPEMMRKENERIERLTKALRKRQEERAKSR